MVFSASVSATCACWRDSSFSAWTRADRFSSMARSDAEVSNSISRSPALTPSPSSRIQASFSRPSGVRGTSSFSD
jgi:hypothetical protein